MKTEVVHEYTVIYHPADEGGYTVSVPSLPGCVSEGDTLEEARVMIHDAIRGYIEVLLKDGEVIPTEPHLIQEKVIIPVTSLS